MTGRRPGIWWTGKSILFHCVLAVVVPGFSALFWWQVQRVREGNTLSWAYVFEWPFFLGYAVYLWWKLVHDTDEPAPAGTGTGAAAAGGGRPATAAVAGAAGRGEPVAPAIAPAPSIQSTPGDAPAGTRSDLGAPHPPPVASPSPEDEELAAYNRYLAELHTTGRPKRW